MSWSCLKWFSSQKCVRTLGLISLLGLELKGLVTTCVECYDFDANIKCPMANCYSVELAAAAASCCAVRIRSVYIRRTMVTRIENIRTSSSHPVITRRAVGLYVCYFR